MSRGVLGSMDKACGYLMDVRVGAEAFRISQDLHEARATVERMAEALVDLVEDVTDPEHKSHDWSEQVCIRNARRALAAYRGEQA